MENKKALKLIDQIIKETQEANIITDTTIDQLKELRPFAVDEKLPVVAKSIRLAYEHIEEYEVFIIPIPQDEPLETEEDADETEEDDAITGVESFVYFMNLIKNQHKKVNEDELREYNEKFEAFAE
ncbi:hypothetical protein [Psychroflexus halocasei]|uniref:Uncharacterized protein n=1 Tax=Psychroflexus halocasei TaxID=908615 RepID=A0A1H3ZFT3_9FLAO|nr:hypothetical protein [Psychroflexus halocasei]SEA22475.1 hypothetical protein SAMN05421540_10463 [Psychroflexus halocasei]